MVKEKLVDLYQGSKDKIAATVAASGVGAGVLMPLAVYANETTSGNITAGMTTALQTAFGNVQTDVVSIVTTAMPYALGIFGLFIAIRGGLKFFRQTSR